jgi:HEAT repeat protein
LIAFRINKVHRISAVWLEAAREAGLRDASFTGIVTPNLEGRTPDGMWLTVRSERSNRSNKTVLRVSGANVPPELMALRRENLMTAIEERLEGPDVETGDEEFDRRAYLRGSVVALTAALDHVARTAVIELLDSGGTIASNIATLEIAGDAAGPLDLSRAMAFVIDLVRRLGEHENPAANLASNAVEDPHPGVRLRNLELLVERFPRRDTTTTTLRSALADPDPAVRLAAARRLGPNGGPMLVALALADATPEPIALEAIRVAGAALGSERAGALLTRGIGERRTELALAAVEALSRCGDEEAASLLAPLRAVPDSRLAAAAAGALAACRGAEAEPELVAALAGEPRELRLAAATALADIGTVNAVQALRAAVASHPTEISLRRAVAKAVGAIQARAQGAAPGQLSLATGATGELALADDDGGRLSLAEEGSDAVQPEP